MKAERGPEQHRRESDKKFAFNLIGIMNTRNMEYKTDRLQLVVNSLESKEK